jgi:hypothetical protein
MGDWKSDADKKYIVCSLSDKFMVAGKIGTLFWNDFNVFFTFTE